MDTLTSDLPTPAERAWSEYLHWVRGADAAEYELTERLAWGRLQLALIDPEALGPLADARSSDPNEKNPKGEEEETEDPSSRPEGDSDSYL